MCGCLAVYLLCYSTVKFEELQEAEELEKPVEEHFWDRPRILAHLRKLREDKAVMKRKWKEMADVARRRREDMEQWLREKALATRAQSLLWPDKWST